MEMLVLAALALLPFAAIYFLTRRLIGQRALNALLRAIKGPCADLGKLVPAEVRRGNGHHVANKSRARGRLRRFPLGRSILIYLAVLAGYIGLKVALLGHAPMNWPMAILAYLVAGLALNRFVLTQVVWHDVYNTLSAVAKAKLVAVLGWPLSYPLLFAQFIIVRHL